MSLTIQDLPASTALDLTAMTAVRGGYIYEGGWLGLVQLERPGGYVQEPPSLPGVPIEIFGGHAAPYF